MTMHLLTIGSNPKTNKSVGFGFLTGILHLSPSKVSKVMNTCMFSTPSCEAGCLNTAGHGGIGDLAMNTVQLARIRRTRWFVESRGLFFKYLLWDIGILERRAARMGLTPVIRLNGTSDLPWERIKHEGKTIFEWFPGVQFYDYTKYPDRDISGISNYSLVFSRSESNEEIAIAKLHAGENVAVVFDKVPTHWKGFDVIDGDVHDLRFLDPKGVVVGLKAKGRAKKDTGGFVVRVGGSK